MNAFSVIASIEGKLAADSFKEYIDALKLTDDIREKITKFDLMHPLYKNGFHPALVLHMIEYNKQASK
jgi:hypothetical protein